MIFALFTLILISANVYGQLIFETFHYNSHQMELSGLHIEDDKLFSVADKKQNHFIYELNLNSDHKLEVSEHINLKNLEEYKFYYYTSLLLPQFGNWFKSPLDFEGITKCGEDFYIVNEQVRHVLKINQKRIEQIDIDFLSYFDKKVADANTFSLNAGFEGIAIDCKHKRLYVAQERSPRRILIVNLDTNEIMEDFDIKLDENQMNPDFAGLFYEKHHLYILERNNYKIIKYDLLSKKVVTKLSFKKMGKLNLDELYNTGEPFGLAEGLALTKDKIVITLDNNQKPLSEKATKILGIKGNGATVLVFKRPKGF